MSSCAPETTGYVRRMASLYSLQQSADTASRQAASIARGSSDEDVRRLAKITHDLAAIVAEVAKNVRRLES